MLFSRTLTAFSVGYSSYYDVGKKSFVQRWKYYLRDSTLAKYPQIMALIGIPYCDVCIIVLVFGFGRCSIGNDGNGLIKNVSVLAHHLHY